MGGTSLRESIISVAIIFAAVGVSVGGLLLMMARCV